MASFEGVEADMKQAWGSEGSEGRSPTAGPFAGMERPGAATLLSLADMKRPDIPTLAGMQRPGAGPLVGMQRPEAGSTLAGIQMPELPGMQRPGGGLTILARMQRPEGGLTLAGIQKPEGGPLARMQKPEDVAGIQRSEGSSTSAGMERSDGGLLAGVQRPSPGLPDPPLDSNSSLGPPGSPKVSISTDYN